MNNVNIAAPSAAATDGGDPRWGELETLQAELLDLRFQRDVGLPFSASEMETRADAVEKLAQDMVGEHRDDPESYGLLCRLIQAAQALPLGVALQSARDAALTTTQFTDEAHPITPYNVIPFLRTENDAERRRRILAHFIQADTGLDSADEARRRAQWEMSRRLNLNPLQEFLSAENMTAPSLRRLLLSLGDTLGPAARSIVLQRRTAHFPEITGDLTWEDSVAVGARGDSRELSETKTALGALDGLAKVVETAHRMGFAAEHVAADLVDRPKKYPGATAYRIRIPSDVRVRVKPLGDLIRDTVVLYHEMGHALHFISVRPELPLPARIGFNFATSETFSFWLESLWMHRDYLEQEIGVPADSSMALVDSAREGFVLGAVGISAAALAIVDFWESDRPLTLPELEDSLSGYFVRFFGYSLPPGAIRWYSGTVLALEINILGYPVAMARLGHLLNILESSRADWWSSPEAIAPVRRLMQDGRRAGFTEGMLETAPFIHRVLSGTNR